VAGTPKFAAQAIRKVAEIGWKTTVILNYPSSSVGATLRPAGLDKSTGVIVGTMIMDPTDSQWDGNEGMRGFRVFVEKYMPGIDIADTNYLFGYAQGLLLEQILKQCGNDLSRENIIKQSKSLKDVVLPTVLPGIRVNTTEKSNMNFSQMRLQRWTGTHWDQFSDELGASFE
jgi:branched-chain amino acid transport system substrate-binding protein